MGGIKDPIRKDDKQDVKMKLKRGKEQANHSLTKNIKVRLLPPPSSPFLLLLRVAAAAGSRLPPVQAADPRAGSRDA